MRDVPVPGYLIDWDISVDSTIVRAHQHAVGARTDLPPATRLKGAKFQNTRAREVPLTAGHVRFGRPPDRAAKRDDT